MRVVIVGAGVAGCVMARQLSKLPGFEVMCLERVSRNDHSGSGTGLNLGPNASKALSLIDPELTQQIEAASYPWSNWRISLTDGEVLFDLPISKVADRSGRRIRWSELYRVMRDAAGDAIAYDCQIDRIDRDATHPNKSAIAWTQNGKAHHLDGIDLLIAADGRYSHVRRTISGEPATRHVGVSIFRLLVPDTSNGLIDDYEQWFNGPNRILAFKVRPQHIYIAGTFPIAPDQPVAEHLKTAEALRAAYTPKHKAPSAQSAWLIDTMCDNVKDTHWARMQEHELLYTPPDRDVLYLGDAAHGMVPTLGQGATQALEDAANAVAIITRSVKRGNLEVRDWLDAFDAARRERLNFIMKLSLAATDSMLEGGDPVAGARHKADTPFLDHLKTLYSDVGVDIDT